MLAATYIVPIRRDHPAGDDDLIDYLNSVAAWMDVILIDGSPPHVFEVYGRSVGPSIQHVSPFQCTANGKIGGVLTGVSLARHEHLVIADDDVRYDTEGLNHIVSLLDTWDVVRPQNYFEPLPWHARWDTARSLLNRLTGGDWPGTLGVRRSILKRTGGYDGGVLFENLELVRTVRAAGGRETVPLDLYVRRRPPDARQFWSQRLRQAYDELARPLRFIASLAVLPLVLALRQHRRTLVAAGLLTCGAAEIGRRRAGGREVFPWSASLLAPAWVLERAVCTWLALGSRVLRGGVPYRDSVLKVAANSQGALRRKFDQANGPPSLGAPRPTLDALPEPV